MKAAAAPHFGAWATVSMTSHLWVLIHKHQSEIQTLGALGPFATVGAAIIAAGVAGTFGWLQYRIGRDQKLIAAAQRDIARARVRMDLHAKRYEIYQATGNVMNLARGRDHAANEEQFHQQRRIVSGVANPPSSALPECG